MDRGRAQAIPRWIAEGWERGLERDFQKLCENQNTYSSRKPRAEVLPPPQQPQQAAPEIQPL